MKARTIRCSLGLWMATALVVTSCSKVSTRPDVNTDPGPVEGTPETYPPIPRPSTVDEIIPDTSQVYSTIVPIAGRGVDFAPTWSGGFFSWDVSVETQKERCSPWACQWYYDPPGEYWRGPANNSALLFENGKVDLRSPVPYTTKRLLFVDNGNVLATPRNPDIDGVTVRYGDYPAKRFDNALFFGVAFQYVDPAFGERRRREAYYVVALSCPQLTNPVYIKRERFWKRLALNGNLKSVTVDPGGSYDVSYTRTQGTSYDSSYTFTRTLNGEISLGSDKSVVGGKLGGSLSQAFGTQVEVHEETSITVHHSMTGTPGKTVVYSVWASVERYSVVDKDGHPYADPTFTFEDLGNAAIQGEYEWISSTSFDYK